MGYNPINASQLSGLKGMILREDASGNLGIYGAKIGAVNSRVVAGLGFPAIFAAYSQVGKAALVANAISFTPPAVAGTYRLFVVVNVHTAVASDMAVTVTFKDGGGNAQSFVLPLALSGSTTIYIACNNTTGVFCGELLFQVDASATAITCSTTGTTQTLYDLAATLEQLA